MQSGSPHQSLRRKVRILTTEESRAIAILFEEKDNNHISLLVPSLKLLTREATHKLRRAGVAKNSVHANWFIKQLVAGGYVQVSETKRGHNGYIHINWTPLGITTAQQLLVENKRERTRTSHKAALIRSGLHPSSQGGKTGVYLIDWENLAVPLHKQGERINQCGPRLLRAFYALAKTEGVTAPNFCVFICGKYAVCHKGATGLFSHLHANLGDKFQFEVVHTRKDAADIALADKARELAKKESFDYFFIASGDKHFAESGLIAELHQTGARVVLTPYHPRPTHSSYRELERQLPWFHVRYVSYFLLSRHNGEPVNT